MEKLNKVHLADFADLVNLYEKTELEKTRLVAFFKLRIESITEFTIKDISQAFDELNMSQPNLSRLKRNLIAKSGFIKGSSSDTFKLKAGTIKELDAQFPKLNSSEEVITIHSILPKSVYSDPKIYTYIVRLADQINASYEHNIFDGCAVLMRRLLEIMLILTYLNKGIDAQIKSNGNYHMLEKIIADATQNSIISLSRNVKQHIEIFRKLGNFSAHRIEYNCRKQYIDEILLEYRATIEELLYKSGLTK